MPLASNADIKIGSYEFELDETIDAGSAVGNLYRPHYKWQTINFFAPGEQIPGSTRENLRAARLWWFDDWAGGEGNRVWYPEDPTVYDFSYGLNPRIRGQLTARPTRTRDSLTSATTVDNSKIAAFGIGSGTVFLVGGRNAFYWTGAAWTDVTATLAIGAGWRASCVGSDPNRVIVGATNGTNRALYALGKTNVKTINPSSSSNRLFLAAGSIDGRVFTLEWDTTQTVKLYRYDVSAGYDYNASTNPISAKAVTGPSVNIESGGDYTEANYGSAWWAGITVANNSLFWFVSTPGQSVLFEYQPAGTGSTPIWNAPDGFTIRDIEYHMGYVYIVGHWGTTANPGFGQVWVHDKQRDEVIPITEPGRTRGLNSLLSVNCASYMNQSLCIDGSNGRVWTYDADEDALTMLDSIATSGGDSASVTNTDATSFTAGTEVIYDAIVHGNQRFLAIGSSAAGTNYQILRYKDDEPSNRQAGTATGSSSTTLTTGIWDFQLPFSQKQLIGFDVVFDPLINGQTITLEYSVDGAAFTTSLLPNTGQITSGTSGASGGRVFFALSTAVSFTVLKVRVTLTGTNAVLPPILYGVAPEAQALQQVWELIIRLKNKQTNQRRGKLATMVSGPAARDYLRTLATAGTAVTFLDGYRYRFAGGNNFTTHTVTVEDPEDIIIRKGEGSMRLVLREV